VDVANLKDASLDPMAHLSILDKGPLSRQCISNNILDFDDLIDHLRHLSYGRLSSRSEYLNTISIKKGTCSSKHAFAKALAIEQGWSSIELILVLYKMNEQNTPGVGAVLDSHQLLYVPEAHCVLYDRSTDSFIDCTFPKSDFYALMPDTLLSEIITPQKTLQYKIEWHKRQVDEWSIINKLDFKKIWVIRENCISALQG